ncbi:MAG: hypothetical protein CM15mP54_23390 [Paracoccaceae bacterium]|nr:MAG: hypothetical protein CM15mP54_23390 [Paracoccaceae bacterium]
MEFYDANFKKNCTQWWGVIFNCMGGCGRSGMFLMRLLLEMGWSSEGALERLREFRPCAIETEQQKSWASSKAAKLENFM